MHYPTHHAPGCLLRSALPRLHNHILWLRACEETVFRKPVWGGPVIPVGIIQLRLVEINNSLGLEDASLLEQLQAISIKNDRLAELNLNLVEKDNTIFN